MVFEEANFPEPPQQDSLHGAPFLDEAALFVEQLRPLLGAGRVEHDLFVRVIGAKLDGAVHESRPNAASTMRRVHEPFKTVKRKSDN